MRVEAVKESKKRFDEVIEAQKAKVSLFKSVPNEEVYESFSEAV
jgi:hypothetical protein